MMWVNPDPFYCRICYKWYAWDNMPVSCCVMHPPGTCCHYGQHEVAAIEHEKDDSMNYKEVLASRTADAERIKKYQTIFREIGNLAEELLEIPDLNHSTKEVALALRLAAQIAATI